MPDALVLDSVTKRYSNHLAVDELSLRVPQGTIYGILGPNGAGKSSTIRMTMNILSRDGGSISLLGRDPGRDSDVLRRVGYLPEERGLYRKMTVHDVIVFFGRLKGMDKTAASREADVWLEKMGLGEWRGGKVETLSKGMQQKVQFISTVLHDPEVLILDEPASGLDPVNQEVLRDTIKDASRRGRTVIFSTHNMDEAEKLCEHVCIIANGRKVLDGRLRELRRESAGNRYYVEFEDGGDAEQPLLESLPGVHQVNRSGYGWHIELDGEGARRDTLARLSSAELPMIRFSLVEPSLHEIFVSRVGDAETAHRRPEAARV